MKPASMVTAFALSALDALIVVSEYWPVTRSAFCAWLGRLYARFLCWPSWSIGLYWQMDSVKSGQLGHVSHIMRPNSISKEDFLRTWNNIVLVRIPLTYDQELIHVPSLEPPTSVDSPLAVGGLD